MSTDRARQYDRDRRQHRLPDTHPAVAKLRTLREAVEQFKAVADAARSQNDRALYTALQELDRDTPELSVPTDHPNRHSNL